MFDFYREALLNYLSKVMYLARIANFPIFPDRESYLLEKKSTTTEKILTLSTQ